MSGPGRPSRPHAHAAPASWTGQDRARPDHARFSDNLIVRPDRRLAIIDWETISLDSPLLDLGMT
ncbi:hypothetical protein GCM10022416_11940 [Actinomadura keratinilytica]|uniref:Uncharacterized protein n=1 Tax=Actinomadura keratinilytica TaxID=547461 RepID=A0ABP7Y8X5_9ACTN